MNTRDPRSIVTPHAFRVEPGLLGLPLAGPWRRAFGMFIDLILIAVLALVGWTAALTFFVVMFVIHVTAPDRPLGRPIIRLPVRALAAILLIGVIVARPASWIRSVLEEEAVSRLASLAEESDETVNVTLQGESVSLDPATLVRAGADAIRFARTDDTLEAGRLAASLVAELDRQGVSPAEILETLGELGADSSEAPAKWRAVHRQTTRLDSLRRSSQLSEDSLLVAYIAARDADSAAAVEHRQELLDALVGDSIRTLEGRLRARTSELADVRRELAEEQGGFSLLRAAANLAEDLGVGFGLSGIYFTVFTVWWRGQTPGKRVLGERVVNLNGKPIGWWDSFNRFGGYAAGLATGTLGFLELIWDANRQAAHDKMVGTVVLRTRARPPDS